MAGYPNNIKNPHNNLLDSTHSEPKNIAHSYNVTASGQIQGVIRCFNRGLFRGLIRKLSGTVTFSIEGAMAAHTDPALWVPIRGMIEDSMNPGEMIEAEITDIDVSGDFYNLTSIGHVPDYNYLRITIAGGGTCHVEMSVE